MRDMWLYRDALIEYARYYDRYYYQGEADARFELPAMDQLLEILGPGLPAEGPRCAPRIIVCRQRSWRRTVV